MSDNLMEILEYEKALLENMLEVIDEQKEALIKYNVDDLEITNKKQEELSKQIFHTERERIDYIQNWLKISKSEASKLKLSVIENQLDDEKKIEYIKLRKYLNGLISKINDMNSMNRVLANRSRRTIQEILAVISGENNHVCNVKV